MSTWTLLTLTGAGKKRVLVRLDAVTCVYPDGKKSRVCFDPMHDQQTALRVDESVDCIAKSLGGMVVICVPVEA